jgi:hypothetical protein
VQAADFLGCSTVREDIINHLQTLLSELVEQTEKIDTAGCTPWDVQLALEVHDVYTRDWHNLQVRTCTVLAVISYSSQLLDVSHGMCSGEHAELITTKAVSRGVQRVPVYHSWFPPTRTVDRTSHSAHLSCHTDHRRVLSVSLHVFRSKDLNRGPTVHCFYL